MRKKIFTVVFFASLLFAGIIALTQESDGFAPGLKTKGAPFEGGEDFAVFDEDFFDDDEFAREVPKRLRPARWFRSNAGGMALEEIPSRFAALRNKYALVIDSSAPDELPEYLSRYYDDGYSIEIRKLYEDGEEKRMQWIFRDDNETTRLIAVFTGMTEPASESDENEKIEEASEIDKIEVKDDFDIVNASVVSEESGIEEDGIVEEKKEKIVKEPEPTGGFIEIFDENALLMSEIRFIGEGEKSRTDFIYKKGIVISANAFMWEENDEGGEFKKTHTDFYRYNRSSFLRAVERVFHEDAQITTSDSPVRIAFPSRIMEAARNDFFMGEKLNSYPEFFGDMLVKKDSRIVFTSDERGRILTETLYSGKKNEENEEDVVVWVIRNRWSDDRIVSISKKEGDIELVAEYEYDSGGDRILERNLKNGTLERVVRTEGKKDIEELYLNNVAVLQAVWEDGRKISERRMP